MNRPRGRGFPPKRPSLNQMAHNARLASVIRQHLTPKPVHGDIASLIHSFAQRGTPVLSNQPLDGGGLLDGGGVSRPHGPMPAQPYVPNAMPAPHTPDSMNPQAQAYARQMLARNGVHVNPGEDAALLWRNLSQARAQTPPQSQAALAAQALQQILAQGGVNPALSPYGPGAAAGSAGVRAY